MPAEAMRPIGVGIGPIQGIAPGMATARLTSSDAKNRPLGELILLDLNGRGEASTSVYVDL